MTEDVAFVALWMFMSAAFGFMIGDAFGDSTRHRRCLEEANDDLRDEVEKARANEEPLLQELKQQRGILDDIHRYLLPVPKGSEKTTG
jgi:hypothetical protein